MHSTTEIADATHWKLNQLADWALTVRGDHIDEDNSAGGTWLGAISQPILEMKFEGGEQAFADHVDEHLDAPEPTEYVTEEMHAAYGVGDEWDDDDTEQADAAAVIAAAVYARLGIPQPEDGSDDLTPGVERVEE